MIPFVAGRRYWDTLTPPYHAAAESLVPGRGQFRQLGGGRATGSDSSIGGPIAEGLAELNRAGAVSLDAARFQAAGDVGTTVRNRLLYCTAMNARHTAHALQVSLLGLVLVAPAPIEMPAAKALVDALDLYNAHAELPLPMLSPKQLGALLDGDVVKLRERQRIADVAGKARDRIRVVGLKLIERPRLLVWLSALDLGTEHSARVVEVLISIDDFGGSVWYQYLRLPWPLRNRHWVIDNYKQMTLAEASGGMIWEHAWSLEEGGKDIAMALLRDDRVDGLDERDGKRAVYLPLNRGGWTTFDLGSQQTLVAVHVVTEMGGWIPDRIVASMASKQLNHMLDNLVARSYVIHEDYTAEYPIFSGDGTLITPQMARATAKEMR
jgi:hypothetical protein